MQRRPKLLVRGATALALLVLLIAPRPADACSIDGENSTVAELESFEHYDEVFVGVAMNDAEAGSLVTFRVAEYWEGAPKDYVNVSTYLDVEEGERYLVVGHLDSGQVNANHCIYSPAVWSREVARLRPESPTVVDASIPLDHPLFGRWTPLVSVATVIALLTCLLWLARRGDQRRQASITSSANRES